MDSILVSSILQYELLIYILIFFALFIEGEAVIFIAFYLAHNNFLNISTVLPVIIAGVIIGDSLWYLVGKNYGRLPSLLRKILSFISKPLDHYLNNHPHRTLFLLKFCYGLNHPTLLRAGHIGTPYRKFLKADMLASMLWIFVIGGFAFLSYEYFLSLRHYLKYFEYGLLASLFGFIIISNVLARLVSKKLK